MSVHYKFKSALEYDTVTFDGLHISVKDLKKAIIHQKRIGKNTDFDLQVTNAQTKEVYTDENALIPKNTSLVIARVPMAAQAKGKPWEGYGAQTGSQATGTARPEDGGLSKAVDLTQLDASEDDKIRAMMTQSTLDYDPSNYMKIRGSNQVGVVPSHYRCFKCHQPGHWIKDCPLGHGQEPMEIKKSTGIPRSFMVPVEGPMVPGAMMTPTGQYAVPVLDHQAYSEGNKVTIPSQEAKPEIPEDLLCSICKDLLTDAVMIPCCGNSFCDECIRTILLESEDHECPDCHEKDISPGTLIPNRFLRNSVSNFKNETGYHKRQQYRNAIIAHSEVIPILEQPVVMEFKSVAQEPIVHPAESTTTEMQSPPLIVKQEQIKPDSQTEEPERTADSLKPIISEADSTETTKTSAAVVKDETPKEKPVRVSPTVEGPPGIVSPALVKQRVASADAPPGVDASPKLVPVNKGQAITSVGSAINHYRVKHHIPQSTSSSRLKPLNQDHSIPNRHYVPPATYNEPKAIEERPGTPTVDEPGMGPPGYTGPDVNYSDAPPPGSHPTTTTLPPSQHMHPPPQIQGPPPLQPAPGPYTVPQASTHQPPPGHYPPNAAPPSGYRMPPPGHPDFNRVGTNIGYGNVSHSMPRMLLISSLDPSVPPPTVPPPQGSFTPRPIYDPTRPPVPYDPHRPPVHGAPPPGYQSYPQGPRPTARPFPPPRHMQPPPPGMVHRPPTAHPPPTVIDDPLEAFNRMLREKDERDRRARQSRRISRSRSYSRSRSSSRSFSRSPRSRSRSPPPRNRHRSRTRSPPPRNRRTPRSRSRSFTMSRSRSFSRSPSFRGSPGRDYSPRRRPPSRYRSPLNRNSPPRYRYKDNRSLIPERDRDRVIDRERDRDRTDRDRTDRDRGVDREREYQYYDGSGAPPADYEYENNYERERGSGRQRPPLLRNPRYGIPPVSRKEYPMNESFYQQPDMCPPAAYPPHTNRYNPRGSSNNYPPPLMSVKTVPPVNISDRVEPAPVVPHRKYDDVAPPGVEQPPVPGFEGQRYESQRFPPYDRSRDDGPPGVDRYQRTSPGPEREEHRETDRPPRTDSGRDYRDGKLPRDLPVDEKERFERKYSPSPDKRRKSISPRRSSRDRVSSPDKFRRRKRDDSLDRERRTSDGRVESDRDRDKKEKRRETSEDEKSKKSKDKKKKKEKKEAERKKKKEKKEKKEQEKLKKAEEKKAKESCVQKTDEDKDKILEEITEIKLMTAEPVFESLKSEPKKEVKAEEPEQKSKIDLYDDIPSDGIDNTVVENYGKIEQTPPPEFNKLIEDGNVNKTNEDDFEEPEVVFDGLELQANESDLKSDFIEAKTKSNEMLAPMPELSKWEIDEDVPSTPEKSNSNESKAEAKTVFERPGKVVTSEVIKRAENAIFAKAINAIRPIEIKKISLDRAKLYSGEKEKLPSETVITKEPVKNIQITIPGPGWNLEDIPPPGTDPGVKGKSERSSSKTSPPPNRLSVKERLGCKVEELDKITKDDKPFERNRSRTLSPLSKRNEENGRNVGLGERVVEIDDRRRDNYRRSDDRSRYDQRSRHNDSRDRRGHVRNDRSKSRDGKSNYRDRNRQSDRKDYRRDDRRDVKKDDRKDDKKDDKRTERSRSRNRSDRRHGHGRDDRHRDEKIDIREKDKRTSRSRRSKSRSESRDRKDRDKRKKSRDKKHKKEKEKEKEKDKDKVKKHKTDDEHDVTKTIVSKVEVESKAKDSGSSKTTEEKSSKAKPLDDKRKSTLDEASFEPDYDLESESEKEEHGKLKCETIISKKRERSKSAEKKIILTCEKESVPKKRKIEEPDKKSLIESSSSESSDSSSDEKHKKKHKKHKKKKSRRDSSSTTSSSESESSVDKKSKRRHKSNKKIKKKKKSKHK